MIRLINLAWCVGLVCWFIQILLNVLLLSVSFILTVTYLCKYLGQVFTCVNVQSFSDIVLWQLVFEG